MGGHQRRDNSHVGWRPDRNGDTSGPYMHATHNASEHEENIEIGLGLLHTDNMDAMSANAELGVWGDENASRIGGRANAQMFKGATNNNDNFWNFDGGVFDADAEASIGNDGATVGAGANVIHGAVTMGNISNEDSHDTQVRAGLGFGMGAAGRAHWGDADGDNIPEIGFGFDAGPVSFDLKSETLGQAWNWLTE